MKRLFQMLDVGVTLLVCAYVVSRLRNMDDAQREVIRRGVREELRRPANPVTIDGECVEVPA